MAYWSQNVDVEDVKSSKTAVAVDVDEGACDRFSTRGNEIISLVQHSVPVVRTLPTRRTYVIWMQRRLYV